MRTHVPRKIVALVIAFTALGAAVAGAGQASTATKSSGNTKTLTFGLLTALSGSSAAWGVAEKASDDIAVAEINNAGGVKVGNTVYKFALKVYDSAYDPTTAATVASQAMQQDGLKFIEDLGGGTIGAVQPIAERVGAMVFCSCTAIDSYLGKAHPLTFDPYYSDADSLAAILKYYTGHHRASSVRVARVYTDDDVGHGVAQEGNAAYKKSGVKVSTYFVPRDVTDYSAILTKVIANKANVIDFGPAAQGIYEPLIKQAYQMGFHGVYFFPDVLDFAHSAAAVPKGALVGSVAAPCNLGPRTPEAKHWAAAYQKVTHEQPQWWSAQSHDNLLLLAKAIKKAQSLDPTKVAAALGSVSVNGATSGGGVVRYGGTARYGLPRAFQIPYPVCRVQSGGAHGTGALKVVTAG